MQLGMKVKIGIDDESYPTRSTYFPPRIETERLTLREIQRDDASLREVNDLFSEKTTRNLLTDVHETFKETDDFVSWFADGFDEGESVGYVLRPKAGEPDAGEFAGFATLRIDWDHRTAEWGIILGEPFWGRGYTEERTYAFAHLVFAHLELEVVEIVCLTGNTYAKRVIDDYVTEFGGHYVGVLHNEVVTDDGEPKDCHRFTITRPEYLESPACRAVEQNT